MNIYYIKQEFQGFWGGSRQGAMGVDGAAP